MKRTYELKDIDGKLFVSVRELMDDVKDALHDLSAVENDPRLIGPDSNEFRNRLLGLHAIYALMGAMCTEHELTEKMKQQLREPVVGDINISATQFNVPINVKTDGGTVH